MNFKVVIVGDGEVGKSALVAKLKSNRFVKQYKATMGADVHPISFDTSIGEITLKIWDTAGQAKLGGLKQGYYVKSDGAILMYDLGSRSSYKNLHSWNTGITNECGDIPRIICGNKCDINARRVSQQLIQSLVQPTDTEYCEISVKTNCNLDSPFYYLIEQLT